jgi:hypothetical protein
VAPTSCSNPVGLRNGGARPNDDQLRFGGGSLVGAVVWLRNSGATSDLAAVASGMIIFTLRSPPFYSSQHLHRLTTTCTPKRSGHLSLSALACESELLITPIFLWSSDIWNSNRGNVMVVGSISNELNA